MNKKRLFSVLDRAAQINSIQSTKYDLLIVGGGITGAGIALDAASRGLKTCLVEKNDFASGTSNKSTKLIHGGLRYLKQFEIGLVKESGRERATVHKLAPHLVIPEKMLLPLIEGGEFGSFMTSLGLKVYDILAKVEGEDKRKMLTKEQTLAKEPLLDEDTLLGGGFYSEYRTDDARLTIEVLKKAHTYEADIINYCELESFTYTPKNKVNGAICIDKTSGDKITINASRVVSAAGPWVDILRKKDGPLNNKHLYLTKGVHVVFPKGKLPVKQAIYFDAPDGRMLFAIPREKITYVGTTDTPYSGSLNRVVTTKEDVNYIINAINKTFKTCHISVNDIESSWAGLRPLIHENAASPSELSRKDEIFVSDRGLISIAGGKLTGYRKMAQRVNAKVLNTMKDEDKKHISKSVTRSISLTTPAFTSMNDVKTFKKLLNEKLLNLGLYSVDEVEYLTATYGPQAMAIVEKTSQFDKTSKNTEEKLLLAELWYGIHNEMIHSLTDFFVRRTGRLFFNIKSVITYQKSALLYCTEILNWDKKRAALEIEQLQNYIRDATTFFDKDTDARKY